MGSDSQQSGGRPDDFIRSPLRIFALGTFAWVGYFWWWVWQLNALARRNRFPRANAVVALFLPGYLFIALYRVLKDLSLRTQGRGAGGLKPLPAVALLWLSCAIGVGTWLVLIAPIGLVFFFAASLLFAAVASSVQSTANAYLRTLSPSAPSRRLSVGEAAATGVGLLAFLTIVSATTLLTGRLGNVASIVPGQHEAVAPTPSATPDRTPNTTPSTLRPANSFSFISEPGDWVGQGRSVSFTSLGARFQTFPVGRASVTISVGTNRDAWTVILSAPQGQSLAVGSYPNAQRAGFASGSAPGLSVSGAGHGCNQVFGSFAVSQIVFDDQGNLWALQATFVQRCEAATAPALRGAISYGAASSGS